MIWSELFCGGGRKKETAGETLCLDKRRGPRIAAAMPVFICGRAHGQPFSENAETTSVSPQPLLVTNLQANKDLACRVACLIKKRKKGKPSSASNSCGRRRSSGPSISVPALPGKPQSCDDPISLLPFAVAFAFRCHPESGRAFCGRRRGPAVSVCLQQAARD